MADKTIGELPNLPAISPLDLLVAQHNEEATKITGATLTNFFKDYIGPVAATSASQMTNTNKVYIYIGNESGYTNGNWYYYNGSTWVSGGAYNSQAVNTDATLTHEGVPADAEAAGKIVEISETQPAAPANRVWIPETQEATVQVPTWAEHQELNGVINSRITNNVESTSTASRSYYVGEYLIYNNTIYKVKQAIASGGTLTPGTNLESTNVGNQLTYSQIPRYESSIGNIFDTYDSTLLISAEYARNNCGTAFYLQFSSSITNGAIIGSLKKDFRPYTTWAMLGLYMSKSGAYVNVGSVWIKDNGAMTVYIDPDYTTLQPVVYCYGTIITYKDNA